MRQLNYWPEGLKGIGAAGGALLLEAAAAAALAASAWRSARRWATRF